MVEFGGRKKEGRKEGRKEREIEAKTSHRLHQTIPPLRTRQGISSFAFLILILLITTVPVIIIITAIAINDATTTTTTSQSRRVVHDDVALRPRQRPPRRRRLAVLPPRLGRARFLLLDRLLVRALQLEELLDLLLRSVREHLEGGGGGRRRGVGRCFFECGRGARMAFVEEGWGRRGERSGSVAGFL